MIDFAKWLIVGHFKGLVGIFGISNETSRLRIDRGSLGGTLHSGASIHNYDCCNSILYIL